MISDRDILKLQEIFITKLEFQYVKDKLDSLEDRMNVSDEKMDHLINSVDVLLGKFGDSLTEHAAGAVTMERHTRQINALGKGTGIVLPD